MQFRRRGFVSNLKFTSRPFETLEGRRMMCLDHVMAAANVVEERPDIPFSRGGSGDAGEPADIIWTNRATTTSSGAGDTDGFGARFGTSAPLARAVVDAVIVSYERMIGSFNYATAGATYSLTVSMGGSGGGFGASAGLGSSLAGKPKSGNITMGAGNGSANANDDNGWFLDPTPSDSAEFLGTIINAYSGNGSVSPANTRSDFYTVVAAEMTHCMGLFGDALPGWASLTTDTGIADTAEAGSGNTSGARGTFWVFDGPSVKHLMTGNNGGSGGSNFGSAVHSAGPTTVTFGGDTYNGAQDQGNAVYETGRRYTVNNLFALMFKDAYGYSVVDPARDGTFYSVLNTTTGALTVRGAASSNDTISITRSGSTITVSVDIQNDVAGTGALPGAGNLPAFVSVYDASAINSIAISGDTGNDSITLGSDLGVNVSVVGSTGTDSLVLQGDGADNTFSYAGTTATAGTTNVVSILTMENFSVIGGDGADALTLTGSSVAESFTLSANAFSGARVGTFATIEAITVATLGGIDNVNVDAPSASVVIDVGAVGDIVSVNESVPNLWTSFFPSAAGLPTTSVSVNSDAAGLAVLDAPSAITLGSLSVAPGGVVTGSGDVAVATTFEFSGGVINGAGLLSVNAGATANAPGSAVKLLERRLRSEVLLNVSDGTLVVAAGLSGVLASGLNPALIVAGLTVASGAAVDLTDNSLVIDYASATPLATIGALISSGYAGGAWNGTGINSSAAAASSGARAIGYGEADAIFAGAFPATFNGATVDATSILVRLTIPGDANLDGSVGFDDLLLLTQFYGQSSQTWAQGNFNYDPAGNVDFDDLLIVSQNYGTSLAQARKPIRRTIRESVFS